MYIGEGGGATTTTIRLVDREGWKGVIPAFQSLSLKARSQGWENVEKTEKSMCFAQTQRFPLGTVLPSCPGVRLSSEKLAFWTHLCNYPTFFLTTNAYWGRGQQPQQQ